MKKILIGVVITSSLVMSGPLEECTEVLITMSKLHRAGMDFDISANRFSIVENKESYEFYSRRGRIFSSAYDKWEKIAKEKCKGVVSDMSYEDWVKKNS